MTCFLKRPRRLLLYFSRREAPQGNARPWLSSARQLFLCHTHRQADALTDVRGSPRSCRSQRQRPSGLTDLAFSRPALGDDCHLPFRHRYKQDPSQPPETFALGRQGEHVPALHRGSNKVDTPFFWILKYILHSGFRFLQKIIKILLMTVNYVYSLGIVIRFIKMMW